MSQRCTAHVVLWESLKPWALGRAASAYPASSNWPHTASPPCKGRATCMDPQYLMQENGARRVLQLGCTPAFLCAGAAGFGVGMMFWAGFMLGGIFIPRIDFKTKQISCCLATPLEGLSHRAATHAQYCIFRLLQSIFAGWCLMQTLLGLFDQQEWEGYVERGAWLGSSGKRPSSEAGQYYSSQFAGGSGMILTLMKLHTQGVSISLSLQHNSVKNRLILHKHKYQKTEFLTSVFSEMFWRRSRKSAFWSHGTAYLKAQQNGASQPFVQLETNAKKNL